MPTVGAADFSPIRYILQSTTVLDNYAVPGVNGLKKFDSAYGISNSYGIYAVHAKRFEVNHQQSSAVVQLAFIGVQVNYVSNDISYLIETKDVF